mmetsp:Transcript_51807/g.133788  ORF Transcript_51807/g.133788 Transcript_51807/m.133788 type:complete len:214 (+) Transcript_51807:212-853(+)
MPELVEEHLRGLGHLAVGVELAEVRHLLRPVVEAVDGHVPQGEEAHLGPSAAQRKQCAEGQEAAKGRGHGEPQGHGRQTRERAQSTQQPSRLLPRAIHTDAGQDQNPQACGPADGVQAGQQRGGENGEPLLSGGALLAEVSMADHEALQHGQACRGQLQRLPAALRPDERGTADPQLPAARSQNGGQYISRSKVGEHQLLQRCRSSQVAAELK